MKAFGLLLIIAYIAVSQTAAAEESQPATLSEVVKRLKDAPATAVDELARAGTKMIGGSIATRWVDELAFLIALANRDPNSKQYRKNIEDPIEVLKLKYKDEPHTLLRVYIQEANLCRDCFQDRKMEREVFEKAERLQDELIVQQALTQLTLYIKLGNNYLGEVDPKTGTQKKSLEYYTKVIDYNFQDFPGLPRYGEYQALYIEAALRLVAMTKKTELKKLRLYHFAFEELSKLYPDKTRLLSEEDPGISKFMVKVERWLEFTAEELPKDSTLRPHFKGVLQYLRKDTPK